MVQYMTFRRTSGRNLGAVRRPHPRYAAAEVEVAPPPEDTEPAKPKKSAKKAEADDG